MNMGFVYFVLGLVIGVIIGVLVMKKYGAMVVTAIQSLEATLKNAIQRIESSIQRVESAIKAAKGIIGLLLLALLVSSAASAQTVSDQYKHLKANWTPPVYQVCNFTATTPVNTSCINGYQEVLTPPSPATGTVTVPPCTATLASACIGPVATYTWGPGNFLYSGTWGISLYAAYLDANGAQQFTAPISTTVVVPNPFTPPSPATGLGVTPAP
jgi:hypothetical protein